MMVLPVLMFSTFLAGVTAQSDCSLDDIQNTKGICKPIRQCPFALGQLYSGAKVKTCSSREIVCCPNEPTLSQKKCQEWESILKTPDFYGQPPYSQPKCALKDYQGMIVGGRDAAPFEYPHSVGIGYGSPTDPSRASWACGATLISAQHVLTAGHCVTNRIRGKPTWAVIGDITLKKETLSYRKTIPIVDWIIHPNYKPPLVYNDIAVLKLRDPLDISRYVLPACLSTPAYTPRRGVVEAIGWGQIEAGGETSDTLQAANLTLKKMQVCDDLYSREPDKQYRYPSGFQRTQLCIGGDQTEGGSSRDTCGGDSGGPVTTTPSARCLFHVIGVTSIGSKFCGYGIPGIYTKVSSFVDWIERTVWS